MSALNIESSAPETAPGVELSPQQSKLVTAVLDLFAGKPTKEKLALWTDDAVFEDPLTVSRGRDQFEAQWYGLEKAFSSVKPLSVRVTSAGNPILLETRNCYTVKGIGKETTIDSVVHIHTDADTARITKVQDKWNGKLPEGGIANAFRRLNAVTMPKMVGVPKDAAEEETKTK